VNLLKIKMTSHLYTKELNIMLKELTMLSSVLMKKNNQNRTNTLVKLDVLSKLKILNNPTMRMKTQINITLTKIQNLIFSLIEVIRKNVPFKEKLNVSNSKTKRNQLVKMRLIIPVIMLRGRLNKMIPMLSKINTKSKRTRNQTQQNLNLNNLIQTPRVTIIVMMRMIKKLKNALSRGLRKSSKVLKISRELPCKPNKLPQMNGQETSMAVLHQSRYQFLTLTLQIMSKSHKHQFLSMWLRRN